jgi:hypothetical protein
MPVPVANLAQPRPLAILMAAALVLSATPSPAQILPWEVTLAEIETGRIRGLAERLNKQYLLYQLRLGGVRKDDLIATAGEIERIITTLETGSPADSIPPPWTGEINEGLGAVNDAWSPVHKIAVASPYDHLRVARQFMPAENRLADPLLLRYNADLTRALIEQSDKLLDVYHRECEKTGLEVCATARTSGYATMLIERATSCAVNIVAGLEVEQNRKNIKQTLDAYRAFQRVNDESGFMAAALNPDRSISARAAAQLLVSVRQDWNGLQSEFSILAAGDEQNFDLRPMLKLQSDLVGKVERLTAALVRYASVTYGA